MTKSPIPEVDEHSTQELMKTSSFPTALHKAPSDLQEAPPLRLLVVGQGGLPETHPLPKDGSVLIGRAVDAGVRIDEESISRRHAILIMGEQIYVQDCGSLNGTRIRDKPLASGEVVEVAPGETFELGKVMAIVQRTKTANAQPRKRFWPHGYFESRLEEECSRRERDGGTFTLVRFHVEGNHPEGTVERAIEKSLRLSDIAGAYGPGEVEVLFLDAPWETVEQICERFVQGMKDVGGKVTTGVAIYPGDGREAAALLGTANAKLRGPIPDEPMEVMAQGAIDRLRRLIDRVAKSDISIILHGETGVGKEVLAREVHKRSDRVGKPFVGLNCAALTETLLESELFGHERGAFSGAVSTKPGLFEVADKGTVFLDEIGEMSLSIQAKLLRTVEERTVLRVGGLSPRSIDVRFLAASHRDLEVDVATGRFRQDLFFRLNGITLTIPPLRDRQIELEGLATSFIAEACRRMKRADVPKLAPDSLQMMRSYTWPGNIRELRNVMERAVLLCTGRTITSEHMPVEKMGISSVTALGGLQELRDDLRQTQPRGLKRPEPRPGPGQHVGRGPASVFAQMPGTGETGPQPKFTPAAVHPPAASTHDPLDDATANHGTEPLGEKLKGAVQDFEKERILDALKQCGGNQTKAAEMLGISRRTLLNRLDTYNLPRPRKGA